MRLFIAAPISNRTRLLLENQINKAQTELDFDLKWVKAKNLHLTLKFLGDTDQKKLEILKETIMNTCSNYTKFSIYYNHFEAFPSTNYPKVLYFGLNKSKKQLIKLQNELINKLYESGFEPEDREYKPHLTFARSRKSTNILQLKYDYKTFIKDHDIRILDKIDRISLIESKLYQNGPVYREIFTNILN